MPAEIAAAPALAGQQVYTYAVVHPIYGEIGTFTDTIDRNSETTRIDGRLRIAVKVLGIVFFREESDTTVIMRGDRLVSLFQPEGHVSLCWCHSPLAERCSSAGTAGVNRLSNTT